MLFPDHQVGGDGCDRQSGKYPVATKPTQGLEVPFVEKSMRPGCAFWDFSAVSPSSHGAGGLCCGLLTRAVNSGNQPIPPGRNLASGQGLGGSEGMQKVFLFLFLH